MPVRKGFSALPRRLSTSSSSAVFSCQQANFRPSARFHIIFFLYSRSIQRQVKAWLVTSFPQPLTGAKCDSLWCLCDGGQAVVWMPSGQPAEHKPLLGMGIMFTIRSNSEILAGGYSLVAHENARPRAAAWPSRAAPSAPEWFAQDDLAVCASYSMMNILLQEPLKHL